jgi:hypothetical protein
MKNKFVFKWNINSLPSLERSTILTKHKYFLEALGFQLLSLPCKGTLAHQMRLLVK